MSAPAPPVSVSVPGAAAEPVVAFAAVQHVAPFAADQAVIAGVAVEHIVAFAAEDPVVAAASVESVVALAAEDKVIASTCDQGVGVGASDEVGGAGNVEALFFVLTLQGGLGVGQIEHVLVEVRRIDVAQRDRSAAPYTQVDHRVPVVFCGGDTRAQIRRGDPRVEPSQVNDVLAAAKVEDRVVAVIGMEMEDVAAVAARYAIVPGSADDPVVPATAVQKVVAVATCDEVVAGKPGCCLASGLDPPESSFLNMLRCRSASKPRADQHPSTSRCSGSVSTPPLSCRDPTTSSPNSSPTRGASTSRQLTLYSRPVADSLSPSSGVPV